MKKRWLFVIAILVFSNVIFVGKVEAATSGYKTSQASVWVSIDGINEMPGGRYAFSEGILTIDGRMAYCADYNKDFKDNVSMTSNDAVDFLRSETGISKDTAQELVTKIALYDAYLKNRGDLSTEQIYFFGQALIWTALDKYFNWEPNFFWVETWNNPSLFPCKSATNACATSNAEYEYAINNGAEEYYNANKTKYKGVGTVWVNGNAQPLMELSVEENHNYDYRPDSLCLDCKTTNSRWSYIYTDMANWEGIKDSLSSDNGNINSYFYSSKIGSKTYACREEIKVKYPDEANKVLVEPGRYFTVGLPQRWSVAIPNFAPITVERTKECRAYDSNYNDVTASTTASEWTAFWNQDSFYKNKDTGTIKITYDEKNGDNKYKGEKKTETYNQKVSDITSNKLTVTSSYKLAGTTYQYVRLDSGLSVSTKPNVAYIDLGVANFPVSYENKSEDDRQAATVTLNYELPDNSKLKKSIGNSNYFGTDNKADEDIYKKASSAGAIGDGYITQGSLDTNQYNDLKHTACVLEYCDADGQNCKSGFKDCMNGKIDSGKTQTNCADYTCNINFKGECKIVGDKYYIDNKEVTQAEYEANGCKCKIEDGKYYLDMKEVTKEQFEAACPPCTSTNCPSTPSCRWDKTNNKYYINNEEVTQSEYLKTCSCTQANNKYYINGSVVDKTEYESVCPPNGPECSDNDPCCLGFCPPCTSEGCKNVIYRTIDLNQPFPGYNAENRKTGANWCTYDVANKKLICDSYQGSLNTVVDSVIFKNRGVTTNPEQEYGKEPIYEVELDAAKIEKLRNYNKKHEYSDFTLNCSKDANNRTVCKMSDEVKGILETSGTCANSNAGNFYTCDE